MSIHPNNEICETARGGAERNRLIWAPLLCSWLLMAITIAAPDDIVATQSGTATILPHEVIVKMKVILRLVVLGTLVWTFFVACRGERGSRVVRCMLPFACFALWCISSTCWSPLKSVTLGQAGSFAILVLLAADLALTWRNERDTSLALRHLSFGLLALCLLLFTLRFAMPSVGSLTRDASGVFHSTVAGATASIGLIVVWASYLGYGWRWACWLIVPGTVVYSGVMIVAGNRLSILVAWLLISLAFFVFTRRILVIGLVFASCCCVAVYLTTDPSMFAVDSLLGDVTQFGRQGQSTRDMATFSGREEMWKEVWKSFLDSPWIGHGYFVTSRQGRIYVWEEWGNWTAHNFVLQLIVTCGLVGATLFGLAVLDIARRLCVRFLQDVTVRPTVLILAILSLWCPLFGLLNESFLAALSPESVVFSVVLGLAVAVCVNRTAGTTDSFQVRT